MSWETVIFHTIPLSDEERHWYEALRQQAVERLDIIDELRENHHKVPVFSQFVDHLMLLRTALDETQSDQRDHMLAGSHVLPHDDERNEP